MRNSLIDKNILNKFGTKDSINISQLIEELGMLEKLCPIPEKDIPFFREQKNKFKISQAPQNDLNVFTNFSKYISKCMNWKSPKMQFSVTPPPTIASVATASIVNLLNPNGVWDIASGDLMKLETEITNYFSNLINWNKSSGIFTFGGTATNMYGIKIGIEKATEEANKNGIDKNCYVITNSEGHSCHTSICNWLGIGTNNCIKIKNDKYGTVDTKELFEKLENLLKQKKKIGCIILNAGTHFDGRIDPIKKIKNKVEKLKNEYKLNYTPHIHADSVTGWVFLLYNFYNFKENKFAFPKEINIKLESIYSKIKELEYADSLGIDFHKTGFCPYLSSLFITKNKNDWVKISGDDSIFQHESFNFGDYKPGQFTLETSRSLSGVVSAYTTLNTLGIEGIQKIIANYFYISKDLREKLEKTGNLFVSNKNSDNWTTIFQIKDNNSFEKLYRSADSTIVKSNKKQTNFYDYLIEKYNGTLPWHIGFAKSYKKNKNGMSISGLKSFPMSPFHTIKDNDKFVKWIEFELKNYSPKA